MWNLVLQSQWASVDSTYIGKWNEHRVYHSSYLCSRVFKLILVQGLIHLVIETENKHCTQLRFLDSPKRSPVSFWLSLQLQGFCWPLD